MVISNLFYPQPDFNSFATSIINLMVEFLNDLDTQIFLLLNGMHSPFFDVWMFRITQKSFWIPLYLLIVILLAYRYKKESIWIIVGGIICIALSDLLVSGFMKPFFERFRPTHDPDLRHLVHTVNNYYGGRFGFASGHAATSFSLSTFMWLVTRKELRWMWLLFLWSILYSYSRIYLGVHYPGDIIVGACLGSLIALGGYYGFQKFADFRNNRKSTARS